MRDAPAGRAGLHRSALYLRSPPAAFHRAQRADAAAQPPGVCASGPTLWSTSHAATSEGMSSRGVSEKGTEGTGGSEEGS